MFVPLIFASISFFPLKKNRVDLECERKFCVRMCGSVCVCEREKPYSWVIGGQLLDHRGPMIDSLTTITLNLNVRERERGATWF